MRWRTHPRFAGDGYVLLDSLRVGPDDVNHDNAAALLECDTPSGLLARATEARRRANGGNPPADR